MQAAKTTPKDKRSFFPFVIFGVIILVVAAIFIGSYLYSINNRDYQSKTAFMKNSVEQATKNLLDPIGGIEHQSATVTHGDQLPLFPCIDVSCPTVESHWYLLANNDVVKSLEANIKTSILARSGSSRWTANIIVGALGESEQPYKAPANKTWFNISIWVANAPN